MSDDDMMGVESDELGETGVGEPEEDMPDTGEDEEEETF
jgi:hypothetical protein